MRSRNIKPGFFDNEILAECEFQTRILFLGLWCYADRDGRFEYRPKKIMAKVFPYDNGEITVMIRELSEKGFIRLYEVNGNKYGEILNFQKHQRPHHTEKASNIPKLDNNSEITVNSALNNGENPLSNGEYPSDSLIPDSLIPENKSPPKKTGGGHFKNYIEEEYLKKIEDTGKKIQIDFPDIWQLIQIWVKKRIHPGAILETMEGALPYLYKPETKNKRGYLEGIMKTKAQNWREKEFIKDHQEREEFFRGLITRLKML